MSLWSRKKCGRCNNHLKKNDNKNLLLCNECQKTIEINKANKKVCPNDNFEMEKVIVENVVLDRCNICKGIWLDQGELEIIQKKISKKYQRKFLVGLASGLASR